MHLPLCRRFCGLRRDRRRNFLVAVRSLRRCKRCKRVLKGAVACGGGATSGGTPGQCFAACLQRPLRGARSVWPVLTLCGAHRQRAALRMPQRLDTRDPLLSF